MIKMNNFFDELWFNNKIIIKRIPYSNENFNTYSENGICQCKQTLDQSWKFCPKCGRKLIWK